MLDRDEILDIRKDLEVFEDKREKIITDSRNIIRLSKQVIYAVHRNELAIASKLVDQIKSDVIVLDKDCLDTNMNSVALQEYVEALTYFEFVKENRIPLRKDLGVDTENYLCGLCDLTGELVRKAVDSVIKKDFVSVFKIKNLLEEIYGAFLTFDLRNGELRKKMDSIKWNLNKVEDVVLNMHLKYQEEHV